MLCQLASLVERGRFDPEDTGRRFTAWFDEGYMAAGGVVFDYGGTTLAAICRLRARVPALDAGPTGVDDNGNGSLMRVLPVSLWSLSLPVREQVELSHRCSRITHGHLRSQVCCALYSLLARRVFFGDGIEQAWEGAAGELGGLYRGDPRRGAAFAEELELVLGFEDCRGTGYVVDCLCSAWEALGRGGDFSETVREAVRYGHDTDTTAAVAGGLAGLAFGFDSIPGEWREGLRLDESQRALIRAFADAVAGSAGLR